MGNASHACSKTVQDPESRYDGYVHEHSTLRQHVSADADVATQIDCCTSLEQMMWHGLYEGGESAKHSFFVLDQAVTSSLECA